MAFKGGKSSTKNPFTDVVERMQSRELVISLLVTMVIMFLALIGFSTLSTVEVVDKWGDSHTIHIAYYGYPLEMMGVLKPIGTMEAYWVSEQLYAAGILRIFWGGLFVDFILYFWLAFAAVYAFTRLRA
jgi:hypothetical protein